MTAKIDPGMPKTIGEWVRYLRRASAVHPGNKDYAAAREAVQFALERIRNLNTAANVAETQAARGAPGNRTASQKIEDQLTALGVGLMQGTGLGIGEPIAGALNAMRGQGFGAGAQAYREGFERVGSLAPTAAAAGDIAGTLVTAGVPIARAPTAGATAVESIVGAKPGILGRFLHGAGQADIAPGLALGGIAGFSAGGEDPGDINARLLRGAVTAAASVAGQAGLAGLGGLRVPRHRMDVIARNVKKALGKDAAPELVADAQEIAIRSYLEKQGYSPTVIEQLMQTYRAGGKVTPRVPIPINVTRPGETIRSVGPREFAVEGPAPPVKPGPTESFWQQLYGAPTGTRPGEAAIPGRPDLGALVPAGPTQLAGSPFRTASPSQAGAVSPEGQVQAIIDFLRGTPREQLPGAIQAVRNMGINMGGTDDQLLALLLGVR